MRDLMSLLADKTSDVVKTAYNAFLSVVNTLFPIVLGVLIVFGIIYSIILGIQYAKAEDAEKRDAAKKHLVGAIVGIVIAAALVAILWIVLTTVDLSGLFNFNEVAV
ncbi:MAG: hypothetical protein IJS68_00170 [Clostridia bacterium]|nr:hypothetical protein [Clostridia bacterium]